MGVNVSLKDGWLRDKINKYKIDVDPDNIDGKEVAGLYTQAYFIGQSKTRKDNFSRLEKNGFKGGDKIYLIVRRLSKDSKKAHVKGPFFISGIAENGRVTLSGRSGTYSPQNLVHSSRVKKKR